ncbi:MAG: hypothetical protein WD751_03300 [Anaerolineales bacterium]
MIIAMRISVVIAVIALSFGGDALYNKMTSAEVQLTNPGLILTLRPIILVLFYLVVALVAIWILMGRERNVALSLFLILIGIFAIWVSDYPNPGFLLGFRGPFLYLQRVLISGLALTLHAATFFMAVGLLRLLPGDFHARLKG